MGLTLTGQEFNHPNGVSLVANDASSGERVMVLTSREAIQDFGISKIHNVANIKYNEGDLMSGGNVSVMTTDLA